VLACGTKVEKAIPSVAINIPTSGETVILGKSIEIVSTSSSVAGIAQVTLFVDGQVVNITTPPQGNPTTFAAVQTWRPEVEGDIKISVVVQDIDGKESEPASVELVVVSQPEATSTPTITPPSPPTVTATEACTFDAEIVEDLTIPDRDEISPGQTITKLWRVLNSGSCDWPTGTLLTRHRGHHPAGPFEIPVPMTKAGAMVDISFEMTAPSEPSSYTWIWSLKVEDGPLFGPYFIVSIIIPELPTPTYTPYVTRTSYTPDGPTPTYTPYITRTPYAPDGPTPSRTPYITPTHTPGPEAQVERVSNLLEIAPGEMGQLFVSCPEGSIVTSGGFTTNPEVLVYTHSKSSNGWQAYGINNSASEKLLHVYATCLSNTEGSGSQVYDQVAVPAGNIAKGSTTCPEGSVVTGGGWASNADGHLAIYHSSKDENGWQIYARNTGDEDAFFNAYAICLSGTGGTTEQYGDNVTITAGSTGAVKAVCEEGTLITGGGFAAHTEFTVYDTSLEKGSDSTWWAYAINPTGTSQLLGSYAICLSFP
jgi:hypothetical protein